MNNFSFTLVIAAGLCMVTGAFAPILFGSYSHKWAEYAVQLAENRADAPANEARNNPDLWLEKSRSQTGALGTVTLALGSVAAFSLLMLARLTTKLERRSSELSNLQEKFDAELQRRLEIKQPN